MAKILIVDDEEPLRRMLETMLLQAGHEVIEAHHGLRALELAHSFKPDLIISDIMMPVLDGLSLCRRLKDDATTAGIPVIIMSAGVRPAGWQDLATQYVSKPFDLDCFLVVIDTCLGQSHIRREHVEKGSGAMHVNERPPI